MTGCNVYFLGRPNLRDEGDNHVFELAVAGGAQAIVTNDTGDFRSANLRFSGLRVLTSRDALKERYEHADDSNSGEQARPLA